MKTLIRNIGQIVSGDIAQPLLDGDSIAIADGKIAAVGRGLDDDADTVIDARGSTVIPGLIDSHCHPVFGDFTPRQRTVDFIDSGLHGGLTTMISAGEVHLPGRPKDIVGLKALAIVAAKAYANAAARRRQGARGRADPGAGHGRGGLRRDGAGRRQAGRRDRARLGQDRQGRRAHGPVGEEARHDRDHPHGRAVHRGLEPDQRARSCSRPTRTWSATSTAGRPR